jgi:hypothetical protein
MQVWRRGCHRFAQHKTPVLGEPSTGARQRKALKQLSADFTLGQSLTPQYLGTVLGLFWRFATSFSAQASLSR